MRSWGDLEGEDAASCPSQLCSALNTASAGGTQCNPAGPELQQY